ncbi:uncharacterized protein LOC119594732 [Penaeus monodon]|uniref:uncharacterized protein LOC119594732 n=1 Tax=Penaeus monodon TaxID=6687 RepID=UPI0018A725EF|nr:uncharacterized protein LOC119594732 [Penaeus monodon]
MSWRPAGRRVTPDFYTVRLVNLGLRSDAAPAPSGLSLAGRGGADFSWIKSELEFPSSENTVKKSHTKDGKRREQARDRNKEREANKEGGGGGREGEHEGEALEEEFEAEEGHRRKQDNERRGGEGGEGIRLGIEGGAEGQEGDYPVRYIRVTRRSILQCDLRPCSGYEVSVTAWAEGVTSRPTPAIRTTTKEGVPSAPTNVSWSPMSPKDVSLRWSPPKDINGVLLNYLVSYSHDQQEWRNHTVSHEVTSTEIRGLISNTNYTLSISGVTGGGVGRPTRIHVYIRAILFTGEDAQSSFQLMVIVVAVLVAVTCSVVLVVCVRMSRLRRTAGYPTLQGNGSCRYVSANGVKTGPAPGTAEHESEMSAYQPMLTSLPPAARNHHLDTKGGPGLHDDGIVANCLHDVHTSQVKAITLGRMITHLPNTADVASTGLFPARDGASKDVEDSLDDIDDDDANSTLLQGVAAAADPKRSLADPKRDLADPKRDLADPKRDPADPRREPADPEIAPPRSNDA